MAAGSLKGSSAPGVREYKGGMTLFVFIICIMAASGGLIFGYDIGISGGVSSMNDFLKKFFRSIYDKKQKQNQGDQNEYCIFDSQVLTTFTSSLYVSGLLASFAASTVTRQFGRKTSLLAAGLSFLVGAGINGGAGNMAMLIVGRILLGIGIGFGNQSVPLYLSEMAPAKYRGGLNIMFQLAITVGILTANIINYGTEKLSRWGWRLSLGMAAVPGAIVTLCSVLLPDTPNSMIERGDHEQGRLMLKLIRGVKDVQVEYEDIVMASEAAGKVQNPWRSILWRRNRPYLAMAVLIPFFQQMTGINSIMFYMPVLFSMLGFTDDSSLYSAVVTGGVNMFATFVAIAVVDRFGRRALFLQAGLQMVIALVLAGSILARQQDVGQLSNDIALTMVVIICFYVSAFAWSWGPLGWLVPSEIFPLEIRSVAQAINVSVNLLFTFAIAQAFLTMVCHLKFGIFFFFAGWVVVMTVFVYFLLPETKQVPIEEMDCVWRAHPIWGRFFVNEGQAMPHKYRDVELVSDGASSSTP